MIPLGLITVAALLPKTWDLKLVDHEFEEVTEDLWQWADMVLLTGMIAQKDDVLALVSQARQRGKRVVVGGPYASELPEEPANAGAHFVVTGEGESAIPIWLEALGRGVEKGIFHETEKTDLPGSPVPRFDLLDLDAYIMASVQTSRGCPFSCEFCDIAALYGNRLRHKSPDQVLGELKALHEIGWEGPLFFSDDNFIGSRKHAVGILQELLVWMKQEGQPFDFWTQASVNLGHDPELIDLMTAANFGFVFLGIESPNEEVLRQAHKGHNVSKPLLEAIRTINAGGLSIVGSVMIGFDGEKTGTGDQIREFIEEAGLPMVMINPLQAIPQTPLWKRLHQEGRLVKTDSGSYLTEFALNFTPTRPREEIVAELLKLRSDLYEPAGYIERAYRFYLTMRPTRKARRQGKHDPDDDLTSPVRKKRVKTQSLGEIRLLMRLIWVHGILARYRFLFWKRLWGIYRANPSRLTAYLNCLGLGENVFYRHTMGSDGLGES
ncbi:MAG: B12-binding domain-containing radical SAM protein [Desulfomonilaceae bacterium]|nr:B12-binding domain-containing radical SAM protein [Desulfomonilaceae bacterium]